MTKLRVGNVFEEIRYCWGCPECGCMNEDSENPIDENYACCDSCGEEIEIEE